MTPCCTVPPHPPQCRRGMTLFEVLIALAIFLAALAAISQLIHVGTIASADGQLQTEAILRGETKLAEIVAGVEPMDSVSQQMFADDESRRWSWSLSVLDGPHLDTLQLSVTVTHVRENGSMDASFTLDRLVRDPQIFADAAAASLEAEAP